MSPSSGSANPAIIRMIVVLPQPDGPRIEKKLPDGTANDTPATAVVASNRLKTPVSSRSAVVIPVNDRRPPIRGTDGGGRYPASVGGFQPIEDLALDILDAGRHGRVPFDVLDRRLREALRELLAELALRQLVGAGRGRKIAGRGRDLGGDRRLHVEVDPLVGGGVVAAFRRDRERVDPAKRPGLRRDVLDVRVLGIELPAAG